MFVLKVKGFTKIPDYIQIRSEDFRLIYYFRADRAIEHLEKTEFKDKIDEFVKILELLEYGKIKKIEL